MQNTPQRSLSRFFQVVLFSLTLLSCATANSPYPKNTEWFEITGRAGDNISRQPIYRVRVSKKWQALIPDENNTLLDTREANMEFVIEDGGEMILIAIHNFPSESLQQRIPPTAQIQRWMRQYEDLNTESMQTKPQAHGGFAGLYFTARGKASKFGEEETTMMAWAMQLDEEHYQSLTYAAGDHDEREKNKQKRSDYTIKAVGKQEIVEKYQAEIIAFARSFELIDEIPERR